MAHRPGFPQIFHFDPQLVDAVDQLSIDLFANAKYPNWPSFHEAVPTRRSPFGIIPLVEDCGRGKQRPCEFLSPQLRFLASSMDSDLPYTPIGTKEERILFKKLLEGAVNKALPLNNNTFHDLTSTWNRECVTVPSSRDEKVTIFPKYSRHLINAYKTWRINSSKADRIKEARESDLIRALKVNPGIRVPAKRWPKYPEIVEPSTQQHETQYQPHSKRQRQQRQQEPHIPQLLLAAPTASVVQDASIHHQQQPYAKRQRQHPTILAPPLLGLPYGRQAYSLAVQESSVHKEKVSRISKRCCHCKQDHCRRPWNRSGKCFPAAGSLNEQKRGGADHPPPDGP
jgi:hypothetical protein